MVTRLLSFCLIALSLFITLPACKTAKQLPYFKDLSSDSGVTEINTLPYEPLRLQTNDEVQITISSGSPEASQFFNLFTASPAPGTDGSSSSVSQSYINLYRVSPDGIVTLPVLGDVTAAGLTIEQLKAVIGTKMKDYLKDAVVTARLTNFKVTVIGEVGKPVVVPVNGQTINVLEAVGAAGDMTVYGIRNNVKVIRKLANGKTQVAHLNFNKSSVLESPYFQLKQNDIVYIEPRRSKGVLASRSGLWVPVITSLLYIGAIIISRN